MDIFTNAILQLPQTEFIFSQLGIAIQIVTVIALLFSGVKYLNKKLDDRINRNIQDKVTPIVSNLCTQISDITNAIKDYQSERNESQGRFEEKTNTAIKYIDKAIMSIRGMQEDDIIRKEFE